jgi:photosystem II stability/assembly factor-like uncharacterized protein
VFSESIAWASGTHGTFLTTFNGGKTWTVGHVPGAENLDFRDVESFGFHAYLLAAGPGEQSRIYKSDDRGEHWQLQFANHERPPHRFYCRIYQVQFEAAIAETV